jgi:regulator of cell morphogenesis and NO signaling
LEISLRTTVAELASSIPHATRVFEKHRIDYCCGGRRPLEEACARAGADPDAVVAALSEPARTTDSALDWRTAPIETLVQHILNVHHVYTWEELPRLKALMLKVARVHGDRHPELVQLQPVVVGLVEELEMHLTKEERILFPYILSLVGAAPNGDACFGSAMGPIRVRGAGHDSALVVGLGPSERRLWELPRALHRARGAGAGPAPAHPPRDERALPARDRARSEAQRRGLITRRRESSVR